MLGGFSLRRNRDAHGSLRRCRGLVAVCCVPEFSASAFQEFWTYLGEAGKGRQSRRWHLHPTPPFTALHGPSQAAISFRVGWELGFCHGLACPPPASALPLLTDSHGAGEKALLSMLLEIAYWDFCAVCVCLLALCPSLLGPISQLVSP